MALRSDRSGQDFANDSSLLCFDELADASRSCESDTLWVEAEEMEQRGVVVVVHDDVFDRLVTDLVSRAVSHPALHAASGEPVGEAVGVVVTTNVSLGGVLDDR